MFTMVQKCQKIEIYFWGFLDQKVGTFTRKTPILGFSDKKKYPQNFKKKPLILVVSEQPSFNYCRAITVQHLLLRPMIAGHQKN